MPSTVRVAQVREDAALAGSAPLPQQPSIESFGRFLVRERELRGMALAQVAEQTRISLGKLRALEEGSGDRLPPRVFVVGYIRAYARCIGLNPDDTVLRYDEGRVLAGAAHKEQDRRRRFPSRGLGLLVLAVALAVAGYALLH